MFVVAMALELQIPLVSLDLPLLWLWNLCLLCSSERVSCTSPDVVHCYFYWKLIIIPCPDHRAFERVMVTWAYVQVPHKDGGSLDEDPDGKL